MVDKEERQEPLEALDALELKLQSLKQQSLELQKQSLQQQLERLGADKEERRREALKLQFEQLKHISTLSGALAVIELGLYSAQLVSAVFWLAISLVVLGLSVYWCVFQMNLLSVDMEFGQPPTSYWGPAIGWVLFLNGLVYLLLQAVPPLSLPILVFLLVLVVTITAIAGYWWIRKLKALNRSLSHRADPASEEGTEDREEHTESPQEPA